ncbi:MAG: N-acetyltransferase, partial [Bacteroidetes bacterium]|nr:N-acetyltransferase [Bacteroidota bacterium]
FRKDDVHIFAKSALKNANHISSYMSDGIIYSQLSERDFNRVISHFLSENFPYEYFGIFYADMCIGSGILIPSNFEDGIQIIYWVDFDFQKQGIATKVVDFLISYSFKMGYKLIEAQTDITNLSSLCVLKKNKFKIFDVYQTNPQGTKDIGRTIIWLRFAENQFFPKLRK